MVVARGMLSRTHECNRLQGKKEEWRLHQGPDGGIELLGGDAFRRGRGRRCQLPAAVRERAGLPAGAEVSQAVHSWTFH